MHTHIYILTLLFFSRKPKVLYTKLLQQNSSVISFYSAIFCYLWYHIYSFSINSKYSLYKNALSDKGSCLMIIVVHCKVEYANLWCQRIADQHCRFIQVTEYFLGIIGRAACKVCRAKKMCNTYSDIIGYDPTFHICSHSTYNSTYCYDQQAK